jgi:mannosyl-oligosaccharide glucosidase
MQPSGIVALCLVVAAVLSGVCASSEWGSYRPGVYHGLRSKTSSDPSIGLMWYNASIPLHLLKPQDVRYTCSMSENIKFEWEVHNGQNYGLHSVEDKELNLRIQWEFYRGETGTATAVNVRLSDLAAVRKRPNTPKQSALDKSIALVVHIYSEGAPLGHAFERSDGGNIMTLDLGNKAQERIVFSKPSKEDTAKLPVADSTILSLSSRDLKALSRKALQFHHVGLKVANQQAYDGVSILLHTLMANSRKSTRKSGQDELKIFLPDSHAPKMNVALLQYFVKPTSSFSFWIEPIARGEGPSTSLDAALSTPQKTHSFRGACQTAKSQFAADFEARFPIRTVNYHNARFYGKKILSSMLGSLGYFAGRYRYAAPSQSTQLSSPVSLFTSVPSRTFFPRGFLWDDAFHMLLISRWSPTLAMELLQSWLGLMQPDGWIPREVILGAEAESAVPPEFLVQQLGMGNPPALMMAIKALLTQQVWQSTNTDTDTVSSHVNVNNTTLLHSFLANNFELLQRHFQWFVATQGGQEAGTFRWRGRQGDHTLTSGLDDYPRSPIPVESEKHVDLLTWMIYSAGVMAEVANVVGLPEARRSYQAQAATWTETLHARHWSPKQMFVDIDGVREERTKGKGGKGAETVIRTAIPYIEHHGYLSIFPFALQVLSPVEDADKLQSIYNSLASPSLLWSPQGFRSLAKSDPLFGSGENYWRGPVWMNLNFLTLAALHDYSKQMTGSLSTDMANLYKMAREGMVANVLVHLERRGYLYEQYDSDTGVGQRSYPFAGWTALILNIMCEHYDV